MDEYQVNSVIINLQYQVGGTIRIIDEGLVRRVKWLKYSEFEDDYEYFTHEEAERVTEFLNRFDNHFINNEIIEPTDEDKNPTYGELMAGAKDYTDSNDVPITISKLTPFINQYRFEFSVVGILEPIV